MNRHQRRAALKSQTKPALPGRREADIEPAAPGLMLRLAAAVLLAPWVLKRVHNPEVLAMLRDLAVQAGRQADAQLLKERLGHSN